MISDIIGILLEGLLLITIFMIIPSEPWKYKNLRSYLKDLFSDE